ncbi:tRNA (carboxymethyluridine(34)-5-O)-methyltransferase alkbh8 [Anticarsia gemmatalis]|uniref:tRNA (carboxymethyluridine(34)-5-O)-methyltransferase alkbh8 n=1 Tax=Anticarsia gemmatalis TaxID=129554 RepID=UPI003F7659F2
MDEDKKTERKRKRFAARLKSSKDITCTDTPGPNIVLCNAGQATGLEKDSVFKLISGNRLEIPLPKFIAEKGETHSFLVFGTIEDAVLFYNSCNGKAKADENGTPLYMNFVEKVPNTEIICPHANPEGLSILNNFITESEEQKFLQLFDWTPETSSLKNRQVKHYGYEFRYGSNDVDLTQPLIEKIPNECDILWERLKEHGFDVGVPDQLTVNKYSPGQGIPSHVDRHSPFGDSILSLSLGSDVVMDWKHHSGKYVPVVVPARSMLIMQNEARYDWQHGITPRTYDPVIAQHTGGQSARVITSDTVPRATRTSLTFRWTRRGACRCQYHTLCDSADKVTPDNLDNDLAANIEELHVHQVYEQIAGHFSSTRHKAWPRVAQFVARAPRGAVLLDLGCGNGKNILPRDDLVQLACERSASLLAECAAHTRAVAGADRVRLDLRLAALRDGVADLVLCIAVIHHFSTQARRLEAVSSIHRLLRSGGRALITVWAKDQTESNYLCHNKLNHAETETQVTVAGVNLPVHENRTQFKHQDLLVPWKLRKIKHDKLEHKPDTTLLRYYHVFEENELDQLCQQVGFHIEDTYYEEGNWCVECIKQ